MRYRFLAAGSALVLVAGTVWLLLAGGRGVAIAGVLTCTLTILLVVVAIFPLPWRAELAEQERLAAAAGRLARAVYDKEAREQAKFLAQGGDARPAKIAFSQPSWVLWTSDGDGQRGSLNNIVDFYERLDRGRLVILGAPGSGKTVLANQLLLDRIAKLLSADSPLRPGACVPVRLSSPAFDPGHALGAGSDAVAHGLGEWIASRVAEDYRLRKDVAAKLVENSWILPVLDGLDEIDPEVSHDPPISTDDIDRAAALIRALNAPAGGRLRPVVVTCRTDRYRELSRHAAPGQEDVLLNAMTVELEPLSVEQVAAYLTDRFPDPADQDAVQRRWRAVIRHIEARPRGQLASALGSPLRLFMAVTAYYRPHTQPAAMTRVPKGGLDQHLFQSYIPAVIEQHSRNGEGPNSPDDVMGWLGYIATQMDTSQIRGERSGSDLSLDQLWRFAGTGALRYLAAVVHGLLTAALLVTVDGWYSFSADHPLDATTAGRIAIAAGVVVVAMVTWRASRVRVVARRLDAFPLRTARGRRKVGGELVPLATAGLIASVAAVLITGVSRWVGVGMGGWLTIGVLVSPGAGMVWLRTRGKGTGRLGTAASYIACSILGLLLAFWVWQLRHAPVWYQFAFPIIALFSDVLVVGLIVGFFTGLTQSPSAIGRPSDLVTQGRAYDLTVGLGTALAFGVLGGLVGLLGFGIGAGAAAGLATGISFGQWWIADSPWLRYQVATGVLRRRQQLPRQPALFLDWAHGAGLLRLSGISIQFRHREFQDWLAATWRPGSRSRSRGLVEPITAVVIAACIVGTATLALGHVGRFVIWREPGVAVSVAFSPNGKTLAIGDSDVGATRLRDVATGRQIAAFTNTDSVELESAAFSPDGKVLASTDLNGRTYLWTVALRGPISTLSAPDSGGVFEVAFSPDGKTVAASGYDNHIYLWNITSKRQIATLVAHGSSGVESVAFAPGGRKLAVGCDGGSTYLWNVAAKRLIAAFTDPHSWGVNSVAFSLGGGKIAVGDSNGSTYLWDVNTGGLIATLADPGSGGVNSVAFSPDGRTLATAGDDGRTYLWNFNTARLIATLADPGSGGVNSVAFSPDGKMIAVGRVDGTDLWHLG